MPRTVLYLETGTHGGGSHQSLTSLVRNLDPNRYRAKVLLLADLPHAAAMREAGAEVRVVRDWQYNDQLPRPLHKAMLAGSLALGRFFPRGVDLWEKLIHHPAFKRLADMLERERPDLAHLNNQVVRHYFGLLAVGQAGLPCVSHLRSPQARGLTSPMMDAANRTVDRYVTYATSLGEFWVSKGARRDKLSVIPNGIEPQEAAPFDLRERYGLGPEAGPIIGGVGYIRPNRAYDFLIRAWPKVLEKLPKAVLVIVGSAEPQLKKELENLVTQMGLGFSVKFVGNDPEGPRVVASLDVLALPYKVEPFGRVLLEGWLHGTPVVASRVGNIADHLTDGRDGLLCDYPDVDSLADALVRASEPAVAAGLAEKGRETVLRSYTAAAHAKAMMALYDQVLENRGAGGHGHQAD